MSLLVVSFLIGSCSATASHDEFRIELYEPDSPGLAITWSDSPPFGVTITPAVDFDADPILVIESNDVSEFEWVGDSGNAALTISDREAIQKLIDITLNTAPRQVFRLVAGEAELWGFVHTSVSAVLPKLPELSYWPGGEFDVVYLGVWGPNADAAAEVVAKARSIWQMVENGRP